VDTTVCTREKRDEEDKKTIQRDEEEKKRNEEDEK